jgi:hypothetical protein
MKTTVITNNYTSINHYLMCRTSAGYDREIFWQQPHFTSFSLESAPVVLPESRRQDNGMLPFSVVLSARSTADGSRTMIPSSHWMLQVS